MKKRIKALLLVLCMLTASFGAFGITSGAASFSVQPQVADGPGVQKFLLTNNGEAGNFTVSDGQTVYADAGASVAFNVQGSERMNIIVTREATGEKVVSRSMNAHFVPIYCQYGDSNPVQTGTATAYLDEGQTRVTVDAMVGVGSEMYECANNSAFITYGTPSVTFQYTKVVQQPRTVTVYFIDENGYSIGSDTFTIQPGSSATYEVPASLTVNGRNYNLAGGQQSTITQDYNNTTASYTVIYQSEAQAPSSPYTISIQYADSETGAVIHTETVTVPVGGSVDFQVAGSYVTSSYTEYERAAGQPSVIHHTSGEATRTYTVYFDRVTEQKPYTITIYCVDSVTGTLLSSASETVEVNGTAVYTLPSSLSHGGSEYLLASGQGTEIRHSYGGSQRTYYVYYNEVGADLPSEYQVAVRYIDITSNETIYSESVTAADGQTLTINVPESYEADGEEYVLLSGQSSPISHNFYSPRRTYAVYYRNVNDTANAGTEVNEIVQIIEVEGEQVEQVVTEVTTPGGEDEEETTVIYDEEGQIIPDENVPLAPSVPETETEEETTEAETAQIEDETVPMAASVSGGNGPSAGLITGISVAAAAVIAAIIAFVVIRKKRREA